MATAVGEHTTGTASGSVRAPRRRGRPGLSIQSKLLIMLLGVSLVSSVVVGAIGYVNGRESLREAAFDQLTTVRELRVEAIETAVTGTIKGVTLDSRNLSAQTASKALNAAFAELESQPISAEQEAELQAYYADTFNPQLEEATGDAYSPTAFLPASNAGKWLQYNYTAQFADFDAALLDDSPLTPGSAFGSAAEQYGDYLSRLVQQVGYEDVLFLNLDGDVVYSAYKGTDLGTNILDGQYRDSVLADAYRDVLATNSVSAVEVTDFERWIPSLNVPTMWVVSPIGNDSAISGMMAAQVPLALINDTMTGDQQWAQQGLGETGEVYLAGEDHLMRSASRELIEDPEQYRDDVISNGTAPDVADRAVEVGGSVLIQPVTTTSVDSALRGETGTRISTSYLGRENLTSYSPVEIEGLHWVAIARIDSDEAFAPVTDFTRNLILSTLGIMLAVSILSLLLAQVFTRPIRRLVDAVRRVAGGDLAVQVPTGSRDEFNDLGVAFNDMATSLRIKQDLIDEQQTENKKLLHTLMPEGHTALTRERALATTIATQVLTVLVVPLATLDTLVRSRPRLAAEIGQSLEIKRKLAGEALATAGISRALLRRD